MMDTHVTAGDWAALFSARRRDVEWMRLQSRVMEHVNGCEQCRELYEKGMALQAAARAVAEADRAAGAASDGAFQAVASMDGGAPRKGAGPAGRLCVCVDSAADGAAFIEDTLEAEGCANKYAMNAEADGRALLDDAGALRLELSGGRLLVALGRGEPGCACRLLSEDEDAREARVAPGGEAALELPPDCFCTLELAFGEGH